MKVLLLGEFSSLHRYLKEGLRELGNIEVTLLANGDSWKKIPGADGVLFYPNLKGVFGKYNLYIEPWLNASKYSNYDVTQLIHPCLFSNIINKSILKKIVSSNKCISMVAAGEDYALCNAYKKGEFEYYCFDYDKTAYEKYSSNSLSGKLSIKSCKFLEKTADIIIPSVYEYFLGYKNNSKCYSVLPFPINVQSILYRENVVNNKLIFFHGLNRELAKGTPFIRKALEKLQQVYPHEVEVIIEGHMPFDKYLEVMDRANVVIDQCCSYGYGINACIAMAQGKVVMTGKRKETLDALNINDAPMFHAQPDVEQLFRQMQYIVEHRSSIPQWGYESRKYVENVHDHVKIAQRYVDAWKSTGKI